MAKKIIIAAVFALLPVMALAKPLVVGDYTVEFDETREADTDGNGTNDRVSYYSAGNLVFTAYDEDEDGEADLWFRYKNGAPDLELADRDGNGEPDVITEITPDEKAEVVYDAGISYGSSNGWVIWVLLGLIAGGIFVLYKYFHGHYLAALKKIKEFKTRLPGIK